MRTRSSNIRTILQKDRNKAEEMQWKQQTKNKKQKANCSEQRLWC